jgi:hypothetical protein
MAPIRRRNVVRIDGATGDVHELSSEDLPDADWAQRAAGLKASLPDLPDVQERLARVLCDGGGCDVFADIDFDDPVLPRGWISDDSGDFCPTCGASRNLRVGPPLPPADHPRRSADSQV